MNTLNLMLCDQCHEREATVYFTAVAAFADEVTNHNFCARCYDVAEAKRISTYNSTPTNPLPADVEHITAVEYLEARAKASFNSADKPAFKHILNELKRFSKTRQRMAFEMLQLAWECLESGQKLHWKVGFAAACWNSIESGRMQEYTDSVERIIMRAFQLRNQSPNAQAGDIEVDITFTGFLIALGKTNPVRFVTLVETLKSQCDSDAGRQLFSEAEKIILESQNPPQTHWR